MKRPIQFLPLLLCLAMLCSCSLLNPKKPADGGEGGQTSSTVQIGEAHADGEKFFMLERLPDIGEYTDKNEIFGRWYADKTDRLIPRGDYGELIPFLASTKDFRFPSDELIPDDDAYIEVMCKYGLATADGKIVVDAVLDYIQYYKLDNGKGIFCMTSQHSAADGTEQPEGFIAASDGSWVIEANHSFVSSVSDGAIVVVFYGGDIESSVPCSFVYDYNGKLLFEKSGSVGEFSEGLASFTHLTLDDVSVCEYIDKNGNTVISDLGSNDYYCNLEEFKNGCAAVEINGLFGIIGKDNNWIIEPSYDTGCRLNSDTFFISDGTNSAVFNNEGKIVRTLPTGLELKDIAYCELDGCGCEDAWYQQNDMVRSLYSDRQVICKENGLPATDMPRIGFEPYFSCVDDSGVKYLFDHNGNTVYKGERNDEYRGLFGNVIEIYHDTGTPEQYSIGDFRLINRKTGEVIEERKRTEEYEDWYSFTDSFINADDGIVVCLEGTSYLNGKGGSRVRVMSPDTAEYLSEEYEYISVVETGAGTYYHAIKGNFITVLDEDFKVVMRLFKEKTD